jgi:hypothetical protein
MEKQIWDLRPRSQAIILELLFLPLLVTFTAPYLDRVPLCSTVKRHAMQHHIHSTFSASRRKCTHAFWSALVDNCVVLIEYHSWALNIIIATFFEDSTGPRHISPIGELRVNRLDKDWDDKFDHTLSFKLWTNQGLNPTEPLVPSF